ncbi:MAG: hypothetical protein RIQ81_2720 [Pseudomonadota bacterium]
MTATSKNIRDKISGLPATPGVYLMKDVRGTIIYVGKAKSLKSRVSSYFQKQQFSLKTTALVREITDLEVILTQTEVEALLLERTLIKHHKPRFNILLRDDKEYPFLRIDYKEPWPRIEKVRRRKDDGAQYLGPFGSAGNLRIMLAATYRIFPLIRCTRHEFATVTRPCNYYHMKLCLGPCKLPVDREMYVATVRDAVAFLGGRNRDLVRQLKEKMLAASDNENYELAATYRDQLKAFEKITEKQSVIVGEDVEADAIGFAANDQNTSFHVVTVRDGKVTGSDSFTMETGAHGWTEAITEFLLQYYDGRTPPPEVLLPEAIEDTGDLESVLHTRLGFPQRGVRKQLIDIALKNAQFNLGEAINDNGRRETELEILKDKLGLPSLPRRMECIDISNFHETAIVASNVCFIGGKPAKDQYRHYTIETVTGAPDDFGSMREAVSRRLERARRDGDTPDLLVIDGGRGQLQAALDAAVAYPDVHLTIVSLAKSRVEKVKTIGRAIDTGAPRRTFERVFLDPSREPLPLTPGSPEYRLMTRLRDEAHRFAITHHRKRRSQALQGSTLESIPGIGTKMRQRLLAEFGGLEGLQRATLEQLQKVKGLRKDAAVTLHAALSEMESRAAAGATEDKED